MKTAEAQKSTTAQNHVQAKRQPFFKKEGENGFFSKSSEVAEPFFRPTTIIQPKLTIGKPNDKYEVEADDMADKVVQKLSEKSTDAPPSENEKEDTVQTKPEKTAEIQAKCTDCDHEEKLQKKEEDEVSETDVEVQEKPIFESNAEQPEAEIQTKPLQLLDSSSVNGTPVIQRFVDESDTESKISTSPDQEEQVQKKEEDEVSETDVEVQEKPIFESNAEQPEAEVQTKPLESTTTVLDNTITSENSINTSDTVQTKGMLNLQAVSTTKTTEPEEKLQEKEDELSETKEEIHTKLSTVDVPQPPDEEENIQTKSEATESETSSDLQNRLDASKGGGSPLSSDMQDSMGDAMGADFSNVRVHTGSEAVEMNKGLNAQAFTHGSDIYFNKGKYDTNSSSGKHLLAHELTHTVQQGKSARRKIQKKAPVSKIEVTEAKTPKIQRFSLWNAARRVGRGIASGARAVGRGVSAVGRGIANLAESAMEMGRDVLLAAVRRVAPDFARLIERDGIRGFLRNLISSAFRSLFNGVSGPIRSALGVFTGLGQRIRGGLGSMRAFIGGAASNTFNMVRTAATSVSSFLSGIVTPVFNGIRGVAGRVKGFFSGIKDVIGVPIMNVLRNIGGTVWENLTGFIRRVGSVFTTVKNAVGGAWSRIKGWFGITADQGTGEGGGIWEWVKGKALALWDTIKQRIEPIKGPLRTVGSILLMLSPAGPALALFRAWPHLRRAFNWVRQQWRDGNVIVRARQYLNTTLMPMLTNGLQSVGSGLVQGANWLIGLLDRVQGTANNFLGILGSPILAPLRGIVNFALNHFRTITTAVRDGIQYVSTNISQIFRRIKEFLMKVWEVVRKVIAIAVNPFGIAGLVLGLAWRALPNAVKGKIIDWIISLLIRVIRAIPSNPILGFLWPFIKNGVLGFMERMQAFETQRKVDASNKMATIMSGGSPSFAFGFIKGIAMGLWEGITGPFIMIRDLFQLPGLVMNFVRQLGAQFSEMMAQARQLIASIAGNAVGTFQSLMNGLRQLLANPRQILDIIRSAIEAAMNAVRGIGATIAERLMNLMEQPDDKIGELLGNLVGQGLFEAVLAFFTAGGSAAAGVVRQVANVLRRVVRNIMPIIRQIVRFLPRIRPFVQRLGNLFGRARTGASGVLRRVRQFIDRVMEWFQNAIGRMTGRGRRGPRGARGRGAQGPGRRGRGRRDTDGPGGRRRRRDRDNDSTPSWLRIRTAIRNAVRRYEINNVGATRMQVTNAVRRVGVRFRGSRPRVTSEGQAKWQVLARHPRLRIPREAADIYKDKATRWRLGRIAVRARLARLTDRQKNMASLRRILLPLQREYGYRFLRPVNDPRENDINIMGGMSPQSSLGRIRPASSINNIGSSFSMPNIQKLGPTELEEVPLSDESDERLYLNWRREVRNELDNARYNDGIARNDGLNILRRTRNRLAPRRRVIRRFRIRKIGGYPNLQYNLQAFVRVRGGGSNNRRLVATKKRLPDGSSRREPIPINWVIGGYPVLTLQATRRNNPRIFDPNDLPPLGRFSARWNRRTTLVVPASQRRAPRSALYGRNRVTIGVSPANIPGPRTLLRRRLSSAPGVRGAAGSSFRTLLRNYGYDLRPRVMEADHVWDLGFGGPDDFSNLWPLNRGANRGTANRIWRQPIKYELSGNSRTGTPRQRSLVGRWFIISSVRRGGS